MRTSKRRGRPRADRARDIFSGSRRIAWEVFTLELRYGRKRGDLTEAERKVAELFGMEYETVKRAASRHRNLRVMADSPLLTSHGFSPLVQMLENIGTSWKPLAKELERRISGMPDDVRDYLLHDDRNAWDNDARALLEFLRAHSIDGTCPQWLIDGARTGRDLLSR